MFQLSDFLSPRPEPLWQLVKQAGVSNVVAVLQGAEQELWRDRESVSQF